MPHPWCEDCGAVRAIGAARSLDLGGLVNVLSRLESKLRQHGYRVTESQRRLIVRRLQTTGTHDKFSVSRDAQMQILAGIVGNFLRIHPIVVESYLRSC